jgi:hypothetical protein
MGNINCRMGVELGGRLERREGAHFSNMLIPFLHSDPHFHRFLHETCGNDYGVRLPRHRSRDFLD